MGEDDLDNLTKKITGGDDEKMDERLDDAAVHMKDRSGETMSPGDVIEALDDDDPEKSADAADELERLAKEEPKILKDHEEKLLDALSIDDSWAKRAALSALGKVGSEDVVERLESMDLPEADEAVAEIRERHSTDEDAGEETEQDEKDYEGEDETEDEEEEMEEEEPKATTPTDGGTESSAASTGEGRALDAAKNGDVDVDFTEIVVLQMLESDKEEPNIYAEESLRYAIREYPDMAMKMTDRVAERLTDGPDDVRRYASIVIHEFTEEYVEEAREYIPQIVESLSDEDDEVSERGQETLTKIAEEYPDDVVGNVAQLSKKN
ncbi:MAG: HEAT repeat domain-containing protein [Halobacteriales archaeon]|nr:HEAT repeat domain-containing protein [Halobacteriales archaeon]